jgi:uncharacterized membrane protein
MHYLEIIRWNIVGAIIQFLDQMLCLFCTFHQINEITNNNLLGDNKMKFL